MRKVLYLLPLLILGGCSKATPEEQEASKYPPPNMMTEEQGRQYMESHKDPRNGGPIPKTGP